MQVCLVDNQLFKPSTMASFQAPTVSTVLTGSTTAGTAASTTVASTFSSTTYDVTAVAASDGRSAVRSLERYVEAHTRHLRRSCAVSKTLTLVAVLCRYIDAFEKENNGPLPVVPSTTMTTLLSPRFEQPSLHSGQSRPLASANRGQHSAAAATPLSRLNQHLQQKQLSMSSPTHLHAEHASPSPTTHRKSSR